MTKGVAERNERRESSNGKRHSTYNGTEGDSVCGACDSGGGGGSGGDDGGGGGDGSGGGDGGGMSDSRSDCGCGGDS